MVNKLELLAPVGRWDVLEAVISSGADAVYLGSKKFNMRLHRSDYNFTDKQLASAVKFAHDHGVKVYVTINNLLSGIEIEELRIFLEFLQEVGVDAVIVQDLGAVGLINSMNLDIELHASTMMNTHSVLMAKELKALGVSRIITSRDITVAQAKEIHEKCDIEVEFFVHGDMCAAQSSQCYASGVLFGKSGNRGECMKPCRWKYGLVESNSGDHFGEVNEGHFLAMNDLCLLQQIPALAQAGICSFKIEGRMRDAKFLKEVISIYRRAIDSYLASPSFYYADIDDIETIYKSRVRNLSSSVSFSLANTNTFDYSGIREPLFLSRFAKENPLTEKELVVNPFEQDHISNNTIIEEITEYQKDVEWGESGNGCLTSTCHKKAEYTSHNGSLCVCEDVRIKSADTFASRIDNQNLCPSLPQKKQLSVKVGTIVAVRNAVTHGADSVYLTGELSPRRGQKWTIESMKEAVTICHSNGKDVGIGTSRITTDRELGNIRTFLNSIKDTGIDYVLVHNFGTLRLARELGFRVRTDFSFNVLNQSSALLLKDAGVERVTISIESSFGRLCEIAIDMPVDMECIVHGQIPFMVLEHCIPAIVVTKSNADGFCRQPCRHMDYGLKDEKGATRPIEVDQNCRNHIFFASDLCILPYVDSFIKTGLSSFRIEAQYYDDDLVGTVVRLYRKQIDLIESNGIDSWQLAMEDWDELVKKSPRKFSIGGFKHDIFNARKTADVIKSSYQGVNKNDTT